MASYPDELIDEIYEDWNKGRIGWSGMLTDVNNAQAQHTAENYVEAQQTIITALWHPVNGATNFFTFYKFYWPYYAIVFLLRLINDRLDDLEAAPPPPEYELTWQKICEAWAANNFEGRGVTIAFIDRMRQLIWDEPFYVAWAARPEEQEF